MDFENEQDVMQNAPAEPEEYVEEPAEYYAPQEEYYAPQEEYYEQEEQGTSSSMSLKKIIIMAAALIVLLIVAISVLKSRSAKSVAEKYAEANVLNDVLTMDKYSVYSKKELSLANYVDEEDFCDSMSDTYEEDLTSWKDYCKYVRELREEYLEDEYGEFDLDIEAKRVEDIAIRKLKSKFDYFIEYLEEELDFDIDDYKKAKDVTVKYTVDGEDDKEKETLHIYLLRDGLSWKVLGTD